MKPLYRYQRVALKRARRLRRCGLFMAMRVGKTRVAIEACDDARILVVLPLSAVGVWQDEVRKWAPDARTRDCTYGTVKQRAEKLRRIAARETQHRIFVLVGYESYWRSPLREAILRFAPGAVIYDEAHRISNRTTRQSRFAHLLASSDNKHHTPGRILALTGTPAPNGAYQMFSIFKSVDPSVFGSSYPEFERRYVVKGGFHNYQIVGYMREPELREKVAAHSYRITMADAFGKRHREAQHVRVPFHLAAKERKAYDEIAKDAITRIDKGQTALAKIVLTGEIRLQQIASGFVTIEETHREVDIGTSRRDMLADLLADVLPQAGRVVVFCRFTHDVDAAMDAARRFCKDAVYRFDGSVPRRDRKAQLAWFRSFDRSVLIMQVQVAEAFDLSCADVGVFYSRDYSAINYDQAQARLLSRDHNVVFYHLVARKTIDAKIMRALRHKQDLAHELLDSGKARRFFA